MKKIFEMTEDEFAEIKSISQQPVMFLSGGTPMFDTKKDAERFWRKLGDKYGFIWDSSEPAGSNPKLFSAIILTPTT